MPGSPLECRFDCRPYARPFISPLQTRYGLWTVRRGLIVRLAAADGRVGWGEIAPIAHFGTESWEAAWEYCRSLPVSLTAAAIEATPVALPACRFGLESAWEWLHTPVLMEDCRERPESYLLPTGAKALTAWQEPWQQGTRTFKWKIGVAAAAEEQALFQRLWSSLPSNGRLRLDANGSLDWETAGHWLQLCDRQFEQPQRARIEFVEQPLPPDRFDQLYQLSTHVQTPIALDESVTTLAQLETVYRLGWQGVVVMKAAIAGSPSRLRAFCQQHRPDLVWSSVFETKIARYFVQHWLMARVPVSDRATGFGVSHWFRDGWDRSDSTAISPRTIAVAGQAGSGHEPQRESDTLPDRLSAINTELESLWQCVSSADVSTDISAHTSPTSLP